MTASHNPEPRWPAPTLEAARDSAALQLWSGRNQPDAFSALLAEIEHEGRTGEVLRQVIGEIVAIKAIICSGARHDLSALLADGVAALTGERP